MTSTSLAASIGNPRLAADLDAIVAAPWVRWEVAAYRTIAYTPGRSYVWPAEYAERLRAWVERERCVR